MIREELFRHDVVVTEPATVTGTYGDPELTYTAPPALVASMRAWVQQTSNAEQVSVEGNRLSATWLLISNVEIDGQSRVTWDGISFEVDGPTAPLYDRRGVHHYETTLKRVEG